MRIPCVFADNLSSPYDEIEFISLPVTNRNADGSIAFSSDDVTVPKFWSVTAAHILARKYCRKTGVPAALKRIGEADVPEWLWRSEADLDALEQIPEDARYGAERDARQVFNRLAGTWTYWGWKGGYFDSEADARNFFNDTSRMLALQMFAPNSPQWFNAGLDWAYGIQTHAGGYRIVENDDKALRCKDHAHGHAFIHSCFIQSIDDGLVDDGGIMDLLVEEARIAKFGSGTGANFSAIRGRNETLSSGGHASGLLAALKAADRSAALVTARGSTRRSSKMVLVDADHPEIEDFIDWKVQEEHKVAAMVCGAATCNEKLETVYRACRAASDGPDDELARLRLAAAISEARQHAVPENAITDALQLARNGQAWEPLPVFDVHWDSDAYHSVSGQNSNNSVMVSDDFIDAVRNDGDWSLINRTSGAVAKTVRAGDLWQRIGYAAWASADPGLQYRTTINAWHTCPRTGPINGSNSCSEFLFLDQTATTLASLNLQSFTEGQDATLDIEAFAHAVRLVTLTMEISVSMALYPSQEMAQRTNAYRPLGLGFTNLGGLLMAAAIPYDSDEGREICGAISALMSGLAYAASAQIAADVGPFDGFDRNRDDMLRVIRNHRRAAHGAETGYEGLSVNPVPLNGRICPQPELVQAARKAWDEALSLGERHGYRNAQATAIAPTGTISLIMDCATLGIEPEFALVKYKTLANGGYLKITNHTVVDALKKLGYDAGQIDLIGKYIVGIPRLEHAPVINNRALRLRGFTDQMIRNAERALASAPDLRSAITPANLGMTFCERSFGLSAEILADPKFDLLGFLGFDADAIEAANLYCCGHQTAEGAPGLSPRHYPIFDCAVAAGAGGQRSLSPESHLRMMAAAQPFVSGGISKTVNMPQSASVSDCRAIFQAAHDLCLKSVAIYRDGSKLSQPMNSAPAGAGGPRVDSDHNRRAAEQIVASAALGAEQSEIADILVSAVALGLENGATFGDFETLLNRYQGRIEPTEIASSGSRA